VPRAWIAVRASAVDEDCPPPMTTTCRSPAQHLPDQTTARVKAARDLAPVECCGV
jgi:hypothetical protein